MTGALGYNTTKTIKDVSDKSYTAHFGGTSAAAPMVSGVVALMLEANPQMSWRDVRYVLASTALKNDPGDSGWSYNRAGLHIHHSYGFGLVDASAALAVSVQWTGLPPSASIEVSKSVMRPIPDDASTGLESTITISEPLNVEFVDVIFDAPDHARIGDLVVTLTSPSGTRSILAERHNQVFETFRYAAWRFGTLRHLGEFAAGAWRLTVQDLRSGETGTWNSWHLIIHGYYNGSPGEY